MQKNIIEGFPIQIPTVKFRIPAVISIQDIPMELIEKSKIQLNQQEANSPIVLNAIFTEDSMFVKMSNGYVYLSGNSGYLGKSNIDYTEIFEPIIWTISERKSIELIEAGRSHIVFTIDGKAFAMGKNNYYQGGTVRFN